MLLGAGFDTRAWRLKSLDAVRIYEVDHPDTASVKRRRLQRLVDLNKVSSVAVDFEIDDFDTRLREAGFDGTRRAIVEAPASISPGSVYVA